jgi:GNAT superfamily N-acetyltransferase
MEIQRGAGRICLAPPISDHRPRVKMDHHCDFAKAGLLFRSMVEQFYRDVGYALSPSEKSAVVVATIEDAVVGILRIVEESETGSGQSALVLRGMFVREEFRNLGIGSRMLGYFVGILEGRYSERSCYCVVPNTPKHLRFYDRAGFAPIELPGIPAFLQERVREYDTKWKRLHTVLCRS